MSARRSPRVAMTLDDMSLIRPRRCLHIQRCRHHGRVGLPVHDPTTILEKSSARVSAIAPSRGPRSTPRTVRPLGLPVPSRGLRLQFVKPREGGVKVCLVEDFAAAAQVAFDREERDLPPLSFKVVLRGPARRMRNDRSDVV